MTNNNNNNNDSSISTRIRLECCRGAGEGLLIICLLGTVAGFFLVRITLSSYRQLNIIKEMDLFYSLGNQSCSINGIQDYQTYVKMEFNGNKRMVCWEQWIYTIKVNPTPTANTTTNKKDNVTITNSSRLTVNNTTTTTKTTTQNTTTNNFDDIILFSSPSYKRMVCDKQFCSECSQKDFKGKQYSIINDEFFATNNTTNHNNNNNNSIGNNNMFIECWAPKKNNYDGTDADPIVLPDYYKCQEQQQHGTCYQITNPIQRLHSDMKNVHFGMILGFILLGIACCLFSVTCALRCTSNNCLFDNRFPMENDYS